MHQPVSFSWAKYWSFPWMAQLPTVLGLMLLWHSVLTNFTILLIDFLSAWPFGNLLVTSILVIASFIAIDSFLACMVTCACAQCASLEECLDFLNNGYNGCDFFCWSLSVVFNNQTSRCSCHPAASSMCSCVVAVASPLVSMCFLLFFQCCLALMWQCPNCPSPNWSILHHNPLHSTLVNNPHLCWFTSDSLVQSQIAGLIALKSNKLHSHLILIAPFSSSYNAWLLATSELPGFPTCLLKRLTQWWCTFVYLQMRYSLFTSAHWFAHQNSKIPATVQVDVPTTRRGTN